MAGAIAKAYSNISRPGGRGRRDEPVSAKGPPPPAHENYRVVLKREGEFEIGSIGIQHGAA
jgi:hypothetical protein